MTKSLSIQIQILRIKGPFVVHHFDACAFGCHHCLVVVAPDVHQIPISIHKGSHDLVHIWVQSEYQSIIVFFSDVFIGML